MAEQPDPAVKKPAAVTAFAAASSSTGRARDDISAGLAFAVRSNQVRPSTYCCGPKGGTNSGSGGANLAISSALRTTRSRAASVNSLVRAEPLRLPKLEVTATDRSSCSPLVVTLFNAKRTCRRVWPASVTAQESALENDSTLPVIFLAS